MGRWAFAATILGTVLIAQAAAAKGLPHERTPPLRWPAAVTAARQQPWLIGIAPDVSLPQAAARAGARRIGQGVLRVPASRARAVGRLLARRGLLRYAEPDVFVHRSSVADGNPAAWARGAVVPAGLQWPSASAEIAVIDDFVDDLLPDLDGHVRYLNVTANSTIDGPHGTMVASAATAAANGTGVMGVTPGGPIASYGLPPRFRCGDVAAGVDAVAKAGVPIVNLSLGTADCFTIYAAVERAYGVGTLVVAAAGNDFEAGNPIVFPAAYPHVLSVAAVAPDLSPAPFSSANAAVDIAAPGIDVPLAIPPSFDTEDGTADGVTTASGTSFAAPIVAGAASWVLGARPGLTTGQVADVLRNSAHDIGPRGWDVDTGWGIVDVAAALVERHPPVDPGEPNDDVWMVNGRLFRGADPVVWRGHGSRTLRASADVVEDPIDVYRIRLPRNTRAGIALTPTFGDPDLLVLDGRARSLGDRRARVCLSLHGPRRTDTCGIVRDGRRPRIVYVAVLVADSRDGLAAGYRLRFRRLRYR